MTIAASLALYMSAVFAAPGAYGLLEEIAGPADCAAVAGNGSLTIGIDATGSVSVCRWPGPTAPNQLVYDGADSANPGVMWAIGDANGLHALPRHDPATIHVSESADGAPIVTVTYDAAAAIETVLVHPERDVAAFQLRFTDTPPQRVVWFADFSPCTFSMPGIPSAERLFPARRDMLAFVDNGVVFHTRTLKPGSAAWDQAESWLNGGAEPGWLRKAGGTWLGYASSPAWQGAVCSSEQGPDAAMALAQNGSWDSALKYVGACASAVSIPVDPESKSATIFVALGEQRGDAESALAAARKDGFAALLDETQAWWKKRLAESPLPGNVSPSDRSLYCRALRNLLLCTETKTGAIARAPHARPALAVDFPRFGAWTTLAFDLANFPDAANRHIEFYARSIRQGDSRGAPAGSLPAALYGSGGEAAPQTVLDVTATAWFLWSAGQHYAYIQDDKRKEYAGGVWGAAERAAEFLSNWCRASRDTPIYSFDPTRMSDTASIDTIAAACAGLRAAGALASAVGKDKPDWSARVIELEDFLRFHALDASGKITIAEPLVLWPTSLVDPGDARWAGPVQATMDRIQTDPSPNALKSLAALCVLFKNHKDRLEALRPLVAPTVTRVLDEYPCDSYYSALAVTIIRLVFADHGP